MRKTILITGATGFLGATLGKHFAEAGYNVVPISRAQYSLGGTLDASIFNDAPQALIHCAWDTSVKNDLEAKRNVEGALALKNVCKEKGVHFVFISSMAAHAEARSIYGRTKLEVEERLDISEDCIIKPGTIIGKGGLFLRTLKLAQTLPVLPVFFKKTAQLQTIYIDDICQAIVHAVTGNHAGMFAIAHQAPVAIGDFYAKVAAQSGKHPRLLAMSGDIALLITRTAEALGLRLPITSDNVLGLKYTHHFDTQDSCQKLDITPLSFDESLYKLGL